jgi:hypothetical protein
VLEVLENLYNLKSTGAETTNDGNGYIDSFDADGFSSIAGSSNRL